MYICIKKKNNMKEKSLITSTQISDEDSKKYASTALALILKKYGYSIPCSTKISISTRILTDSSVKANWNKSQRFLSAPLLEDITDWISDNFEIVIQVMWLKNKDEDGYYVWVVYDTTKSTDEDDAILLNGYSRYTNRYDALADGIKSLFEEFDDFFDEELLKDEIENTDNDIDISFLPSKSFAKVEICN